MNDLEKYTGPECDGDCENCSPETALAHIMKESGIDVRNLGLSALNDLLDRQQSMPSMRTELNDNGITVLVDLPGVKKEDVALDITPYSAEENSIRIKWSRAGEDARVGYARLNTKYDITSATATLEDGILAITVNLKPTISIEVK